MPLISRYLYQAVSFNHQEAHGIMLAVSGLNRLVNVVIGVLLLVATLNSTFNYPIYTIEN